MSFEIPIESIKDLNNLRMSESLNPSIQISPSISIIKEVAVDTTKNSIQLLPQKSPLINSNLSFFGNGD